MGNASQTQLNRIQKLQNFSAKVVDGRATKFDHVTPILRDLKWLNVRQQFYYEICIFVFKIINGFYPDGYLTLPTVGDFRLVLTRQSNDLFIPRARTDMGLNQICIKAPKTWNRLPAQLREISSIYMFKNKIKDHIIRNF